ncbi:MAG: FAD-binding oxidoreductase [Proteobacteria bacterium]|nr:FAD-binding oxidoreductase [Pseudomonadota bacterium]
MKASSAAPQGYYAASSETPALRGALNSDMRADICVIGGGFTGLTAALHLARAGARVILLEAETVGFAASGRNGGQIHTGYRMSQPGLEKWLGRVHAHDLWDLCEESKALVRALAAELAPEANVTDGLIIAAHDRAALRELGEEIEHLSKHYSYSAARMIDANETHRLIGADYFGGKLDMGGGHLHPLRYARGLARGAETAGATILEHSRARSIETSGKKNIVYGESGKVTADFVLLATDAFSADLAPELAPYIGHVESFMSATAPLPPALGEQILPMNAAVADTRHVLDYYRKSDDGRLLFAGREGYWNLPADIAPIVRRRMLQVFPMLKSVPTEYAWSGTVGITVTRLPHFGRLSPRVLFAHGYSGQGVALTSIGGKLMAEAALGNSGRFDVMARVPAKKFPGGPWLRKPLVAAALFAFKIADAF